MSNPTSHYKLSWAKFICKFSKQFYFRFSQRISIKFYQRYSRNTNGLIFLIVGGELSICPLFNLYTYERAHRKFLQSNKAQINIYNQKRFLLDFSSIFHLYFQKKRINRIRAGRNFSGAGVGARSTKGRLVEGRSPRGGFPGMPESFQTICKKEMKNLQFFENFKGNFAIFSKKL